MTITEIKHCELDILKWFDGICKEHHLTYWLAYGTLIGAVRHKGFIPWDDDIDLMMPREDYKTFCSLNICSDRYKLLTPDNTKNYPYAMGKVIDTYTIKKEPVRPKFQVIGVDVDIFPVDNYPSNVVEAKYICEKIQKCQMMINSLTLGYGKGRSVIRTFGRNIYAAYYHIMNDLGIMSVSKYIHKINKLAQSYNKINTGYKGNYILISDGINHMNKDSVFSSSVDVEFEGGTYPAPCGYDTCLRNVYGDYMVLPPVEHRVSHHSYKAFWK